MSNKQEIQNTLNQIIDYVGADPKYKKNAQLKSYLEWLVDKSN